MEGVTLVMCPGTSSSTSMVGVKISIAKISHTKILLEVRKFSLEMHLGGNAGDWGRTLLEKNYSNRCFSLVGLGLKCGGVLINKVRLPPSRVAFFV